MRKLLVAAGVILVAGALVALAYTDTQLRIELFGSQIFSSNRSAGFQPGGGFVSQSAAASIQETGYMKVASYLLGAGGLALISLGSALPAREKKKEEIDTETPSQPPPWESPEVTTVPSKETSS
jgi:hypothetical protein